MLGKEVVERVLGLLGRISLGGPVGPARLENNPELLSLGPEAVLYYSILDQVVDEYAPVVAGLENDIDAATRSGICCRS